MQLDRAPRPKKAPAGEKALVSASVWLSERSLLNRYANRDDTDKDNLA
jgi:hypothetical protein